MAKTPRRPGISAWHHMVGKPKMSRRNKLREATVVEKRSWPLAIEFTMMEMEKLSVEKIQTTIEKLRGTNAHERMSRRGLAALRRFIKANDVKDWTRD